MAINPTDQMTNVLRAQWERYKSSYTPVEDELIDSLDENNAPRAAQQAQAASIRGQQATDRIRERYGIAEIDPNLGNRIDRMNTSLAGTSAFNQTRLADFDRRDNVRQNLVQVGQSLLNQSTGGLSSASNMQSQRDSAYRLSQANWEATRAQQQAQYSAQRSANTGALVSAGIMAAAAFF